LRILKDIVQTKLGNNIKITESLSNKPKVKIINIRNDELKMGDNDLLDTIRKQNRIETINEGFHI